jgi:hypothetical protein
MKKLTSKLGLLAVSVSLLAFAGCNSPTTGSNTWSIEGVDGPTLTYSNNVATIYATLTNVTVTAGATVPIPDMPNSSIEIAPNVQGGGMLLQATISAADVAKLAGANLLPPTELPGGRPLPGVAGGTLPAIAVQVPALDNITFYVGANVFGLFVPVGNFSTDQIIGTFQYYDSSNNLMGDISVVGEDANGKNSGFLLMISIPAAAKVMQDQGKLDVRKLLF